MKNITKTTQERKLKNYEKKDKKSKLGLIKIAELFRKIINVLGKKIEKICCTRTQKDPRRKTQIIIKLYSILKLEAV